MAEGANVELLLVPAVTLYSTVAGKHDLSASFRSVELAMIKVRRIRYATFETPDLEKALAYYTQVNGLALAVREKDRAFLATRIGELAIELQQGRKARCLGLSFEVAASADLAVMGKLLSNEEIKSEERCEAAPGIPRLLSFRDPNGTTIQLFSNATMSWTVNR